MKMLLDYTICFVLLFPSLTNQAQKVSPKYTFRSEVGKIDSVGLMLKLGSTEGIITVQVTNNTWYPFGGAWEINGAFHQLQANTIATTDTTYESVGDFTLDILKVHKKENNKYEMHLFSDFFDTTTLWLDKVYGKDLQLKLSGNRKTGYKPMSYTMHIPKALNLRLDSELDTSFKTGERLSLKKGATLRWEKDSLNEIGVMITFKANQSWSDGWGYIVPSIEYGQNNVLTKDDGSYEISEKDLQNFPNNDDVMIAVTVSRFTKETIVNNGKHIQVGFKELVHGPFLYRRD